MEIFTNFEQCIAGIAMRFKGNNMALKNGINALNDGGLARGWDVLFFGEKRRIVPPVVSRFLQLLHVSGILASSFV